MNTKNKNHDTDETYFPFTIKQLRHLRKEIDSAGGFHELMFTKEALERKSGMKYIAQCYDTKSYKNKYLKGVYTPLREFFDTDVPFTFWDQMYSAIESLEAMPS